MNQAAEQHRYTLAGTELRLRLDPLVWAPTGFARRMAEHLAPRVSPGSEVLELGLGSGVLAILAGLRGARRVVALDVNDRAPELARENWIANGLDPAAADFRRSNLWSALDSNSGATNASDATNTAKASDAPRFDLVWSNPPVLPDLGEARQFKHNRDDFEVSGADGRIVLDAVLSGAGQFLKPDGQLLTIATSLQGWRRTEELLQRNWGEWEILESVALDLTDECTPEYRAYWEGRSSEDGERRIWQEGEAWLHDVWFLRAARPVV